MLSFNNILNKGRTAPLVIAAALFLLPIITPNTAHAAGGGIDPTYPFAWSEKLGWLNFGTNIGNVQVSDTTVTGYVWSETTGWINLAPNGSAYVANDIYGNLSGYAWGEGTGYIDFSGATIDTQGYFHGYASSTITGRISLNCDNTSSCGLSNFKVKTYWQATTTPSPTPTPTPPGGGGGGGGGPCVGFGCTTPSTSTPPTSSPTLLSAFFPTSQPAAVVQSQITRTTSPATTTTRVNALPDFLFDVNMTLDSAVLSRGADLIATALFTNFGSRSAPVGMVFSVVDQNDKKLYTSYASTTVQTENIFAKRFPDLVLEPGNYSLVLDVTYGNNQKTQIDRSFSVIGMGSICNMWWPFPWLVDHAHVLEWFGCLLPWYVIISIIILVALWFAHRRYKQYKTGTKEDREKDYINDYRRIYKKEYKNEE